MLCSTRRLRTSASKRRVGKSTYIWQVMNESLSFITSFGNWPPSHQKCRVVACLITSRARWPSAHALAAHCSRATRTLRRASRAVRLFLDSDRQLPLSPRSQASASSHQQTPSSAALLPSSAAAATAPGEERPPQRHRRSPQRHPRPPQCHQSLMPRRRPLVRRPCLRPPRPPGRRSSCPSSLPWTTGRRPT